MTEVATVDTAAAERRAMKIGLRLDAIADNYLAVMPMIRESIDLGDHLTLGYRSPGEYLMERFGEALAHLPIPVRRAAVKELAASGLSTRAIAPIVGASKSTVSDDLSGVQNRTPEPEPDDDEPAEPLPDWRRRKLREAEDTGNPVPITGPNSVADPGPPKVTGIDGKQYTRPQPKPKSDVDAAVTEFPDLAYYVEVGRKKDAVLMAGDLRTFRERGELEERLRILRRSIEVDRAKRNGTHVPPSMPPTKHCATCTCR